MKSYPPRIYVEVAEGGILESLLQSEKAEMPSEYVCYAGKADRIEKVQPVSSTSVLYALRNTPGLWPHEALKPRGRRLTVNPARPLPDDGPVQYQRSIATLDRLLDSPRFLLEPSFKLYVGNLPFEMCDTALFKLFRKFGGIHSVSVISDRMTGRSRGFGFVRMNNEEDALQAAESLRNQEVLDTGEYVSDYIADIDEGETWEPIQQETAMTIIETAMRELARLVCLDPGKLQTLEWRDLERLLAVVFDGIGYAVRLTQPARDGGKDIVVQFVASGQKQSYYVEVKHWVSGKKVGKDCVSEFLSVVVKDQQQGGILISTSGFSSSAMQGITEIERRRLRLGDKDTVVSLCRTYLDVASGLFYPVDYTDTLTGFTQRE